MKTYLIPTASVLLGTSLFAAHAAAHNHSDSEKLAPMVVTANRSATPITETLSAVSVVTREDIEKSQAQDLKQLLQGYAGVQFVQNGGLGKSASLFVRGSNSGQTLILVDGVRINSPTSGGAPLQDIPLGNVERIEIVRGPQSSLYGSDAIGGVIQIFTRKGDKGFTPYFTTTAGSQRTFETTAGFNAGNEQGWVAADVSALNNDGFNVKPGQSEQDKDGYKRRSAGMRSGVYLNENSELSMHFNRTEGVNEYDGTSAPLGHVDQTRYGVKLNYQLTNNWLTEVSLDRSLDESAIFNDAGFSSYIDTRRTLSSWTNTIELNTIQQLVAGVDYQDDKVKSTTDYAKKSRFNTGAFAQYRVELNKHLLEISGRYDDNEHFGDHETGRVGWGYRVNSDLRAFASYATAFQAPSFNDLYWPLFGNPDLLPEESKNYEIGVAGKNNIADWRVSLFQNEIDNLIVWQSGSKNIGEARIRGLEAELTSEIAGWTFNNQLTLQDPEDLQKETVLIRRARQQLRIDADKEYGAYSFGVTALAVGNRQDGWDGTTRLGGYTTYDLRAGYQIDQDWKVSGRIENLFDKSYETAASYAQAGRGFFVTLAYRPQ